MMVRITHKSIEAQGGRFDPIGSAFHGGLGDYFGIETAE
jgi:hypothetical protein